MRKKGSEEDAAGYEIAAIPTLYGGRQYRSRLEAKWAAFFDLLGWSHEYEPYDLGLWSPDFLVSQPSEFSGRALVEVKPKLSLETLSRMQSACEEKRIFSEQSDVCGVVLVGAFPELQPERREVHVGWLWRPSGDGNRSALDAIIGWSMDVMSPGLHADFVHVDRAGRGWLSLMDGDAGRCPMRGMRLYPEHTMSLWNQACNAVKWRPPA